ncbi:Serine/threonine protein kinase [Lentzea waywayandensis]|uniref:non-specific serine/threonine protein kinase n=1 Tax=Lentzea waywayandensis TaxID=84724 RepID=A0A1I6D3B6_9PSEU|nr:serine/threonine-protein kinase [Lentzea waywayandensis]SFQ99841.1 Serine/threonine protein kinase [Lentzea waywayandensis]
MTLGPPDIPHFEYRGDIGGGGFAMVYRYYHHKLKRDVAVKVPKATGLSEDVRERFIAEGESMAELGNHQNVATVYDTDTAADGRPFLVMEYCPGGDLAKISAVAPLPVGDVLDIGVQIACAVETAHERRILHRDIKPANVLMNEYGKPCLTDFGIAGRFAENDAERQVMLSVPWSAPELLTGAAKEKNAVLTEVFSLGATLWHLIVGHSPFMPPGTDNSIGAVEQRIVSGWLPSGLPAPEDLRRLLLGAMATEPEERPLSALKLALGLQRIQKAQRYGETALVLMPAVAPRRQPAPAAPAFVPPPPPVAPPTQRKMFTSPLPASSAPHTVVRKEKPSPQTILRPPPPVVEPRPDQPVRLRWPHYAAGALATVVIVGVGVFLLSGQEKQGNGPAVSTVADDGSGQNAGADNAPPGRPAITATRLDAKTVRFTWNYSAQQATDTFSWRTSDDARTGVAKEPQVDVEGAQPLCLQVKVVRADGSNATADWSQESCG